jgi:hypothetical protein
MDRVGTGLRARPLLVTGPAQSPARTSSHKASFARVSETSLAFPLDSFHSPWWNTVTFRWDRLRGEKEGLGDSEGQALFGNPRPARTVTRTYIPHIESPSSAEPTLHSVVAQAGMTPPVLSDGLEPLAFQPAQVLIANALNAAPVPLAAVTSWGFGDA